MDENPVVSSGAGDDSQAPQDVTGESSNASGASPLDELVLAGDIMCANICWVFS
jgi:hypothetical protein